MPQLDHESAILEYLQRARYWVAAGLATRQMLDAFISFYQDTRIIGSELELYDDSDMFFIETGPSRHIGIPVVADVRDSSDDDLEPTTDQEFACISIYRTVHPVGALQEDSEFDDDGFNMHLELYFNPIDGESRRDWPTMETTMNPAELGRHLPEILDHPKLQSYLAQAPSHIEAFVGGAG